MLNRNLPITETTTKISILQMGMQEPYICTKAHYMCRFSKLAYKDAALRDFPRTEEVAEVDAVTENLVALGFAATTYITFWKDMNDAKTALPLPQLILTMAISWPIAAG